MRMKPSVALASMYVQPNLLGSHSFCRSTIQLVVADNNNLTFEEYLTKFHQVYDVAEIDRRRAIYEENVRLINHSNSQGMII